MASNGRINVSMTAEFYNKLKCEATKSGMGISEYIRYAIKKLWENKGE